MEESKSAPKKSLGWLKIVIVAFVVGCILALSATAFYFYRQYKKAIVIQNASLSEEEQIKKEAQSIKETIGQFMELPENEDPTLATITDIGKLENQPFFAKAQNGDRVLIYTNNKKAILYRPSTGKIVEVSTISGKEGNDTDDPTTESPAQNNESNPLATEEANLDTPVENKQVSVETPTKIAVYNGGRINGLAQRISDKIVLISGVTISEKNNAIGSYKKNLVIDLSGSRQELAQKIAEALGGEVGTLPEGEIKPEADILVIAGKE